MAQKTLAELMDERLAAIEGVVSNLADQAGPSDPSALNDLRVLLIDVVGLLQRDPGVSATADDLYAAGAAVVRDRAAQTQPMARQLRVLRDSRRRFHERLLAATARLGPAEYRELHGAAQAYAAAVAAPVPRVELGWYRRLIA